MPSALTSISSGELNAFRLHSKVENTNSKVWLAFLQPCNQVHKAAEAGQTTFPFWVDPRPLYLLAQMTPGEFYFPVVYEISEDSHEFLPFGTNFRIDQTPFIDRGTKLSKLPPNARKSVVAQLIENYPELVAPTDTYFRPSNTASGIQGLGGFSTLADVLDGKDEPRLIGKNLIIRYFSTVAPFIFYGIHAGQAILFNGQRLSDTKELISNNNWATILKRDPGFAATSDVVPDDTAHNYLHTIFNDPGTTLGRGTDSQGSYTRSYSNNSGSYAHAMRFASVGAKDANETNILSCDPNQPAFRKTATGYHVFHRSRYFIPGRFVFYSASSAGRTVVGQDHSFISTDGTVSIPQMPEEGHFLVWDAYVGTKEGIPQQIVVGREFSRHSVIDTLFIKGKGINRKELNELPNPLVMPMNGRMSSFYMSYIPTIHYEDVGFIAPDPMPTPKFDPLARADLSPLELGADFLFAGEIVCNGVTLDDVLQPIDGSKPFETKIVAANEDVFIDVSVPLHVYLSRATEPYPMSQLQLASVLVSAGPTLPIGYTVTHPITSDQDTFENLTNFHRQYGLSNFSKKQKPELYNDIQETATELARPSIKEYFDGLKPEDQAQVSLPQSEALSTSTFLTSRHLDPKNAQKESFVASALECVSQPTSRATDDIGAYPGIYAPWVGSIVKKTGFLDEEKKVPSSTMSWKVNLHLVGRIRGTVVANPNTSPLIMFTESKVDIMHMIPSLPKKLDKEAKSLTKSIDTKAFEMAERSLWDKGKKDA